MDSLYSQKRKGLQDPDLQKSRQEENAVIVSLLGAAPGSERGFDQAGSSEESSASRNDGIRGAAARNSAVQIPAGQSWISRSSAADDRVIQSAAIQDTTAPNSTAYWNSSQQGSMAWNASPLAAVGQDSAVQSGTAQNEPPQDTGAQNSPNPQRDMRVSVPLAFQNVDPNALKVSDEQQQVLAQIRQNFVSALGGDNQDPSTPQYLNRWQSAQRQSDEEMRAMLGGQAFLQYQLQIAHQTPGQ
jgi:hypothetical protein